jgi:hypothetical protein
MGKLYVVCPADSRQELGLETPAARCSRPKLPLNWQPPKLRKHAVSRDYEPVPGQWYENLEDEDSFRVLTVDEDSELVEIEYLDGNIEEIDLETWHEMDLEPRAVPEGWSESNEEEEEEEEDDDWDEDEDDDEEDDEDDDDDENDDWDEDEERDEY